VQTFVGDSLYWMFLVFCGLLGGRARDPCDEARCLMALRKYNFDVSSPEPKHSFAWHWENIQEAFMLKSRDSPLAEKFKKVESDAARKRFIKDYTERLEKRLEEAKPFPPNAVYQFINDRFEQLKAQALVCECQSDVSVNPVSIGARLQSIRERAFWSQL
jgi:hypothetical protein